MFWIIISVLIVFVIGLVALFLLSPEEIQTGMVEIVEVDGKYAVRQFGYRSNNDFHKIVYEPYAENFGGHWIDVRPEWFWFNEKIEKQYTPVELTLFEAKSVALKLNNQYQEFLEKEKAREIERNKENKRIKAFENGKVINVKF